jgi:hypothetical protein
MDSTPGDGQSHFRILRRQTAMTAMTFPGRSIDLECTYCCTAPTCGDGSNGGPSIFGATQVAKGPH